MYPIYRLKFEDRDLEPIEDVAIFTSRTVAMAAFVETIDAPDDDLGSVYVTEDHGDDERVIAGRTFV